MCLMYTMHTKVANPLGNQKKTKKTKGPSKKHSKTIEKTKKKQKKTKISATMGVTVLASIHDYRENYGLSSRQQHI